MAPYRRKSIWLLIEAIIEERKRKKEKHMAPYRRNICNIFKFFAQECPDNYDELFFPLENRIVSDTHIKNLNFLVASSH